MQEQFAKAHSSIKQELLNLHRQNLEMSQALTERENENRLLQEKVRTRETTIAEMHSYIRHYKRFVCEQDLRV
jgi:hypothetical protein